MPIAIAVNQKQSEDMINKSAMSLMVAPAGHGDCFLVKCGEINILVDSGPSSDVIHGRVINALSNALCGQPIHLAIITHYDDDHIGGLERILGSDKIQVDALFLNSPLRIREHIDIHNGDELPVSANQALSVAGKLSPCNDKAIIAGKQYKFFQGRVVLTMLSPKPDDIISYGPKILKPLGEEELVGSRGRVPPTCGTISQLLSMVDKDKNIDTSQNNALSLAFILTFEERSILFLGDSWPSRVTPALRALCSEESRIPLELVCVSHHGSKYNNTKKMYQYLSSLRYVISSDGDQHPDVETISRILRSAVPDMPEFYFSENTQKLANIFSKTDIKVHFPVTEPLSIDLE